MAARSPLAHPEILRYFMTIPEAVQPALQEAALAEVDVFLVDVGEPVRIKALAERAVVRGCLDSQDPNP